MDNKDLRRLSRVELLEMLLEKSREADRLQQENEELKKKLKERRILVENAGSIAEASLQLNGVFEAAQLAANQYVENIRLLCEEYESKLSGSK